MGVQFPKELDILCESRIYGCLCSSSRASHKLPNLHIGISLFNLIMSLEVIQLTFVKYDKASCWNYCSLQINGRLSNNVILTIWTVLRTACWTFYYWLEWKTISRLSFIWAREKKGRDNLVPNTSSFYLKSLFIYSVLSVFRWGTAFKREWMESRCQCNFYIWNSHMIWYFSFYAAKS